MRLIDHHSQAYSARIKNTQKLSDQNIEIVIRAYGALTTLCRIPEQVGRMLSEPLSAVEDKDVFIYLTEMYVFTYSLAKTSSRKIIEILFPESVNSSLFSRALSIKYW